MNSSGLKRVPEDDESETSPLYDDFDEPDQRTAQETKGWNLFREIPVKKESGSMVSTAWIDQSLQILKLLAYIVVFAVVLGSAVIAKGTLLFITSQLKKGRQIPHCNRRLALDEQFITTHALDERVAWLWAALIVFGFPEFGIFLRSCRICFFKSTKNPSKWIFLIAFFIETLQAIGLAILMIFILPELDVVKGAMLMNAMCFVPAVINALTRDTKSPRYHMTLIFDILAISAQATAFVVWPLLDGRTVLYLICVASVFISIGWWESFIGPTEKQTQGYLIWLAETRDTLKMRRYNVSRYTTIWKILVFMACIMISLHFQGDDPFSFFTLVKDAFSERTYTVKEVQVVIQDAYDGMLDYIVSGQTLEVPASWATPLWVSLIQIGSAYICFASGKLACKILIQNFSFTFALSLVGPVAINLLIVLCGMRNADACAFHNTIPDNHFFDIPPVYLLRDYVGREMAWVWILWLLSQAWICFHAWRPRCERLASSEKLFSKPWYCGPLIDQSLLMNRTQDDLTEILVEDLEDMENMSINSVDKSKDIRPSDATSRVYVCATMWHETKEEMIEFLKSMFRLDEDQCARRVAQKYWGIVDPDYYELEVNIFMDDAFEVSDHSMEDSQVNRFVKCLVDTVDEAASEVHLTNVRLRAPKKYPTPYGGKLVWTMPGKNKLICHMKDKSKIRHRKRWSQVMYMYYFLGHRLMDMPVSVDRKEVIAENTYLLALDGDIDFKPSAVTLLIDLMKKNSKLGAACGRIHPVGSGFMAWYQKFEYAIGHWLQKATEHMIGCVLCSPGCFSLFRGKALMDDNVMKKYTLTPHEARHYVQYDQGEDRWLCTLLLQRGYRVEYSAASDSYTHCPERFDEFFNQRRRWVPSTMANILDLLSDSKHTVRVNDSISTLYIAYQRGYRVEYSAASDSYTHCPERFDEFFNQRRRWVPSTMANILDLLSDSKHTVRVNDSISTLYIAYQSMLMAGTVLGPGTIFLMMVGAMNAITGISNMNALFLNLVPISIFIIVCMTCKSETQLFLASIITCAYAMVMMMVIIGIVLQIIEDGWLAPSSIFTILVFGSFFVTGALHPQEIGCLLYLVIYYITIPSMYMLLIIYSLCNLNNVSWGTREVVQKKTLKEMEQEKKEAEEAKKKIETQSVMRWLGKSEETEGSMEFGVAGLFRCMCCTNPKDHKDELHLVQIANSIEKIEKKLSALGAPQDTVPELPRRSSMGLRSDTLPILPEYEGSEISLDVPTEVRDPLINPFWIEDPNLQKGEVDFLTTAETEFWKDMIDTYLRPIDENKEEQDRIKTDLKNLRDKMVFAFVMLNALFVLVIFLLQLNQDQLHLKWPLGQKHSMVYDDETNVIHIDTDYLMLEPIGSVFLIFFGAVMLIQFTAMIFHRWDTLCHMLSTIQIKWYFAKKADEVTQHALIQTNAVDMAKELQKLNIDDLDKAGMDESHVTRRKTVHNLERARESKHNTINLDSNFKRRLQDPEPDIVARMSSLGGNMAARRATLKALQLRRESVVAERRRTQMLQPRNESGEFLYSPDGATSDTARRRPTGVFLNRSYEPDSDSDNDDAPVQQPRKSTRFML